MKRISHVGLVLLLVLGMFSGGARLHAQASPPEQPATAAQPVQSALPPHAEKVDAPESNKELEAFRHSPAVQKLAREMGLDTEFTAKLFEDLNSAIMIGAILWLVFLFIPRMYRKRSEVLDKQILDATLATTRSRERLAVVEERLSKLDVEIAEIREQSERDSLEDEKRIRESLEAEKQRLMESVEQEIASAGATARRDLKTYAASLAIERAMAEIRLTEDDDRALIRGFGQDLKSGGKNGYAGSRNGERN